MVEVLRLGVEDTSTEVCWHGLLVTHRLKASAPSPFRGRPPMLRPSPLMSTRTPRGSTGAITTSSIIEVVLEEGPNMDGICMEMEVTRDRQVVVAVYHASGGQHCTFGQVRTNPAQLFIACTTDGVPSLPASVSITLLRESLMTISSPSTSSAGPRNIWTHPSFASNRLSCPSLDATHRLR
jgi:hypothetical protein